MPVDNPCTAGAPLGLYWGAPGRFAAAQRLPTGTPRSIAPDFLMRKSRSAAAPLIRVPALSVAIPV